jgi:antirestriction protein ArdC
MATKTPTKQKRQPKGKTTGGQFADDVNPEAQVDLNATIETEPTESAPTGDVSQQVTDAIIAAMEKGVVPWKSHINGGVFTLPKNMSSEKTYSGANVWMLMAQREIMGYESEWWGTYKQIKALGGQVRKDEKSTIVTFWKTMDSDEIDPATGQKKRSWGFRKAFRVFNADQCDNLPEAFLKKPERERTEHERQADAEAALVAYIDNDGPAVVYGGHQPHYTPSLDKVTVPDINEFDDRGFYYGALFHELAHSTGHASRLAREGVAEHNGFGSETYSKEELVAELSAAMCMSHFGLAETNTTENSAAYVASWIAVLKGDKNLIFSASSAAQKAVARIGVEL